jgi:16S rRNA processing protein RimM
VEPISDLIQGLQAGSSVFMGPDHEASEIVFIQPHRQRYLLSLTGCESREQAERWRDHEVLLQAGTDVDLPEGTYYHWQIIGLTVETEEGERLGQIQRIIVTGANDVYLVKDDQGDELLLPAIDDVIRQVDLDQDRIIVHLLPGLRQE